MNRTDLLWYVALVGIAMVSLALGYWVHLALGAIFWAIATLVLLAVRPY